ncbi:MAG TPA: peptidylprolyl isomerase [Terriglobia bacterium]|nr:peptidylprolyl isomerase [Terriglobia bacterium]
MKKVYLFRKSQALLALFTLAAAVVMMAGPGYPQQASPQKTQTPPAAPDPAAPSTATPEDKVVIKVGDQQVTAGDIDFVVGTLNPQDQKSLATEGKGSLASRYIDILVLEEQALRDHLDGTPEFRRAQNMERAQLLAQAEYQKLAGETKVSPDEINQYYTAHASEFERVEVRQVAVRVKPAGAKADTPGLSLADAKARAEEIRKALAAPGADAQKIEKQYAVANEVFITPSRTFERAQLPGALADQIFKLKDGEISDTKETPQSVYFVQALKHVHADMKEVSPNIEGTLRQEKLTTAMNALKNKTTVWSDEEYFKAPASATKTAPSPAPASPSPEKQPPK